MRQTAEVTLRGGARPEGLSRTMTKQQCGLSLDLVKELVKDVLITSQPKAELAARASLPAVADLWGRVSGVVRGFGSSIWRPGTTAAMPLVRTVGMIGCHRVYI